MRITWLRRGIAATAPHLFLALWGCLAPSLPAAEWQFETVDPGGGGQFSSLRIDRYGNAHVAYVDPLRSMLKYGFWDHVLDKWFTTNLDITTGFCSLALDSQQRPHISYIGHEKLKYARWDGQQWEKQMVQVRAKHIDFYTSITLDAKDNPGINFYEIWGTGSNYLLNLRRVAWQGTFWTVMTVDGTIGSGKFNAAATDSTGNTQIAFANVRDENASLRYARWNGESWDVTVLEGAGPANFPVFSVNIATDRQDRPHIAYTDLRNQRVKYATRRDDKWQSFTVDSIVRWAYPDRNGIAVDDDGNPYISYHDAGAGTLKVAHREGIKWVAEILDTGGAGYTSSLQIAQGTVYITYFDPNSHSLKFARRPLAPTNVSGRTDSRTPSNPQESAHAARIQ